MATKKQLEIGFQFFEYMDQKQKEEIKELNSKIVNLELNNSNKDKQLYSFNAGYDKLLLEASNLQQEKEDLKIELQKYKEKYG